MDVLTPEEVGKQLKVSVETARGLMRTGEIPSRKVGRKLWRTSQAALDRYLQDTRPDAPLRHLQNRQAEWAASLIESLAKGKA